MQRLSPKLHSLLLTATGATLCAIAAFVASVVFNRFPGRALVPLVFVILIAILAAHFGVAAGIFGTVLSALIFANWLYQPLGSIAVQSQAARAELAWMLLGGVSLSYLLGLEPHERK
jgi:K+-sensing histidine kinase KdpD